MGFLEKVVNRIVQVFQFILVFLFILFEEIIWEGIARPIYQKIQSLKILQKLEAKIQKTHRYVSLISFVTLLVVVELSGIVASIVFVQGFILLGLLLYLVRIPLAAFVFWFFKVAKEQLLSFHWFKWAYMKLMSGIDWLKSRKVYISTMAYMVRIKEKFKDKLRAIKLKYFNEESKFMKELKQFYNYIKKEKKGEDKKVD
ncbi:MAG TPA: hypothetical protein ENK82_01900 [Campylobacterales bacterium]|nr:hypothetical protein [Campylobacterales bacterium]